MKYFRYLRLLSSLLIVGLFSSISFAQTDISGVIVNPEPDGISIQTVQDDLLTPVSTAQVFRLLSDQSNDWYIGTEDNVALSPNGMYLAIVATRADESGFFIYDLQIGTQRQYPLATEASRVQWSANSTLLLISLVSGNTANVLYDYQADTFLPERQLYIGFGSQYVLLLDGITTIYAGIDSTCSVDCSGEDIYIANINDPNPLPITNLRSLVPAYAIPNICDFTWSESQQLIYVYVCYLPESANNNPDLDIYIGTIYGFDLAGNLQFSLSMDSLFTGDIADLGEAGQFFRGRYFMFQVKAAKDRG